MAYKMQFSPWHFLWIFVGMAGSHPPHQFDLIRFGKIFFEAFSLTLL
jgi:hypothetical protein